MTVKISTDDDDHEEDENGHLNEEDLHVESISNVVITLNNTSLNADSNGEATFTVNPGTYKLRVDVNGYKIVEKTIRITTDRTINIELEEEKHSFSEWKSHTNQNPEYEDD